MPRGRRLAVFLILGVVSLLADMTYEGARSVAGPYLRMLGAGLVAAGLASVGEPVGHAARLLGGWLAYRAGSSRALWGLVIAGYVVNLGVVPLLAFAYDWRAALALLVAERLGKGLRAPPRDAILAEVSRGMGAGKAFSIHEVLDQAGAVAGPLVVAAAASGLGVREAFLVLAAPAGAAVALVVAASLLYPRLEHLEEPPRGGGGRGVLPGRILAYSLAAGLGMAGFIHWVQAGYAASAEGASAPEVAGLYALAMLADAAAAVAVGVAFDAAPWVAVAAAPLAGAAATAAFALGAPLAVAAAVWGAAMGAFEVAPRAFVARAVSGRERSLAYGVLYFSLGAGWTLGNLVIAFLGAGPAAAVYALAVGASAALLSARAAKGL